MNDQIFDDKKKDETNNVFIDAKKNHIQQKDFECSYVVDFVDK